MLDLGRPISVPVPDAAVFADTDDSAVFHVYSLRPRLATGADGRPELSALLRRSGADRQPEGGHLSVTTVLTLTPEENRALLAVLGVRAPDRAGEPARPVRLQAPQWRDGEAHVHLAAGVELSGRPSLMGDNRCAMVATLDATAAATLIAAWAAHFPAATITYSLVATGGRRSATEVTAGADRAIRVRAETVRSEEIRLVLDVAMDAPAMAEDLLTVVDL